MKEISVHTFPYNTTEKKEKEKKSYIFSYQQQNSAPHKESTKRGRNRLFQTKQFYFFPLCSFSRPFPLPLSKKIDEENEANLLAVLTETLDSIPVDEDGLPSFEALADGDVTNASDQSCPSTPDGSPRTPEPEEPSLVSLLLFLSDSACFIIPSHHKPCPSFSFFLPFVWHSTCFSRSLLPGPHIHQIRRCCRPVTKNGYKLCRQPLWQANTMAVFRAKPCSTNERPN